MTTAKSLGAVVPARGACEIDELGGTSFQELNPHHLRSKTVPSSAAIWQQAAFTAEQLRLMKFEPISWIVPEIIPAEGVTLLCSKPKFGKSWLAYELCIGSTTDRFILGEIKPAQGDVLYLALEDSKRRLQCRMRKLLPTFSCKWPERLTITTEWRRLHEGGLDDIRAWYEDTKAKSGKPITAYKRL